MWRNLRRIASPAAAAVPRPTSAINLVLILIISSSLFLLALFLQTNWYTLTYFLRPLWDNPPSPFTILPHFYSPNLTLSDRCSLHNWHLRPTPRRVFDSVIFSNEIDLLEIRWRELEPLITSFLLVESNGTFTGHPKPLWFDTRSRTPDFNFTTSRLLYKAVSTPGLLPGQDPFDIERLQRQQMSQLIEESGIESGDLLIMSDADEIPSFHTIELLRGCDGFPSPLHLQMKNFLYSFDYLVDHDSWRSTVHEYQPGTSYGHSRRSDTMLADAGWHCSFCLRSLADIVFKMSAYSHADRVRRAEFLSHDRIQKLICQGRDLYDMLPEEYSYRRLISKMGAVARTYSAVNLPSYLLKNAERFKFLLPGNCMRGES